MSIAVILTRVDDVSSLTHSLCLNAAKTTACTVELKINVLFYTKHLKVKDTVTALTYIFTNSRLSWAAKPEKYTPKQSLTS